MPELDEAIRRANEAFERLLNEKFPEEEPVQVKETKQYITMYEVLDTQR